MFSIYKIIARNIALITLSSIRNSSRVFVCLKCLFNVVKGQNRNKKKV